MGPSNYWSVKRHLVMIMTLDAFFYICLPDLIELFFTNDFCRDHLLQSALNFAWKRTSPPPEPLSARIVQITLVYPRRSNLYMLIESANRLWEPSDSVKNNLQIEFLISFSAMISIYLEQGTVRICKNILKTNQSYQTCSQTNLFSWFSSCELLET